jgi:hypothetical protein
MLFPKLNDIANLNINGFHKEIRDGAKSEGEANSVWGRGRNAERSHYTTRRPLRKTNDGGYPRVFQSSGSE